jgi:hypothetical protein
MCYWRLIFSLKVTIQILQVLSSSGKYCFSVAGDSLKANNRPTWLMPKTANVQDKPTPSSSRLTLRKEGRLYQADSYPSLGIKDISNDPVNTPFPFFPSIATFGFPPFWQPLSGTGNYGLLVNRVARLEEEIRRLKLKIVSIDGFLRCVNTTSSPSCAGLRPVSVSASTPVHIPSGSFVPFVSSQTATGEGSGVVVSSTYNRPAGSEGHGTVTVQHFGNRPRA